MGPHTWCNVCTLSGIPPARPPNFLTFLTRRGDEMSWAKLQDQEIPLVSHLKLMTSGTAFGTRTGLHSESKGAGSAAVLTCTDLTPSFSQKAAGPWASWNFLSRKLATQPRLPTPCWAARCPVCHLLLSQSLTFRHPPQNPRQLPAHAHRAPSPPVAPSLACAQAPAVDTQHGARPPTGPATPSNPVPRDLALAVGAAAAQMAGCLWGLPARRLSTFW